VYNRNVARAWIDDIDKAVREVSGFFNAVLYTVKYRLHE
jgi:hypothetical protein